MPVWPFVGVGARSCGQRQAAHCTVRCRCIDIVLDSDSSEFQYSTQRSLQLPTIALVFNFSQSAINSGPLLSLHDVETLHHEWGHALHSLLSKTKFQHLSGSVIFFLFQSNTNILHDF